jgi:hypothetical protein
VARQQTTFGNDLRASLEAWRTAPALPFLTIAIGLLYELPDVAGPAAVLISLPALLLLAGWAGTQRVWYLRIFRGSTLERAELWPMTRAFMGRYIVLGFVAGIPFALVIVPLLFAVQSRAGRALVSVPVVFAADLVLTFVTSALAFSTQHVPEALTIGWRTLWDGWPGTAPYALVAPLVVIGIGQSLGGAAGGLGSLAVSEIGLMVALLCKGATSAYYLRTHRVPDSGAA